MGDCDTVCRGLSVAMKTKNQSIYHSYHITSGPRLDTLSLSLSCVYHKVPNLCWHMPSIWGYQRTQTLVQSGRGIFVPVQGTQMSTVTKMEGLKKKENNMQSDLSAGHFIFLSWFYLAAVQEVTACFYILMRTRCILSFWRPTFFWSAPPFFTWTSSPHFSLPSSYCHLLLKVT